MAVMTATVPAAGVRTLATPAGVSIAAAEVDVTLAAGDSITFQNNGDCVLKLQVTTSGTGTINALSAPNNQALTLTSGQTLLIGPLDPAVFGADGEHHDGDGGGYCCALPACAALRERAA
jgi:hypothetical protein